MTERSHWTVRKYKIGEEPPDDLSYMTPAERIAMQGARFPWNRHFVEMLCALWDAEADFLVVGAHALAAHELPRATPGAQFESGVRFQRLARL